MKNITLTLNEAVLAKARIAAAREGKSLSRFVAELVERRVGRTKSQSEALQAWLSGPVLFEAGESGRLPTREELYDDAILGGREHPDLHAGLPGSREAADRDSVDIGPGR